MELRTRVKQSGISVVGLIFILAILGVIGVLGLKIVPTYTEFLTIKKAILSAKASGSIPEIKKAFDRQAEVGYIDAISAKDLDFVQNGSDVDVSFAYQKKIPLVGPAVLLLEYEGTTAKVQPPKKVVDCR